MTGVQTCALRSDFEALGSAYARRGYVFLAYSGLGFGGSGCKIQLDDPDWDGKAGKQIVSFLGGSHAASDGTKVDYVIHDKKAADGRMYPDDPRLGMIGGSYGGQIQFATAATDPRVDTLVPLITWNDLRYSLAPNNTSFTSGVTYDGSNPGTEKIGWAGLFFGVGILDGLQGATIDPARNVGCPNFVLEACQAKATLDSLGYPTAATNRLTDRVSVGHYIDKV